MIKKIIFINLVITIILVLSLEIFVRIFKLSELVGIESSLVETNNDFHSLKKNSTGIVYGKVAFTDSNGFRIPSKDFSYSDDKPSIFFIGDSTTFANGVIEKHSFVGKLRSLQKNYNIYNSAVPGYNIFHHQKTINKISSFLNIKKIFYVFTLNDIIAVNQINELRNEKFLKINFLNYVNKFLRNKSYLYMYIKGTLTDPSKRYFNYVIKAYNKEQEFDSIKDYFSKLNALSKEKNIELKVLILPYEFQTRENKCSDENLMPQSKIVNVLNSINVGYENYTKFFCKYKKPKKLFYKFDPMHLSKIGHDLVFSKILEEF